MPQKKSENSADSYGKAIVRLAQLGEIDDPIAAVEALVEQEARLDGAVVLAEYFGARRNWTAIDKLIVAPTLTRAADKSSPNPHEQRIRLKAVLAAVAAGASGLQQDERLLNLINAIDFEASALLRTESDPKRISSFPWRDWAEAAVVLGQPHRIKTLLAPAVLASGTVDREKELNRARCTLASALRDAPTARSAALGLRERMDICRGAEDEKTQFDALLREALRADGLDAETRSSISSAFEQVSSRLNQAIKAMHQRRPDRTGPELHVNLAAVRHIRSVAWLYAFTLTSGTPEDARKVEDAVERFLNADGPPHPLERTVVVLRMLEFAEQQKSGILRQPRWQAFLKVTTELALSQSDLLINQPNVNRTFDENIVLAKVPKMLVSAGMPEIARQLLRNMHVQLRDQYKDALGVFVNLCLAAAAQTIDYREFATARISEGLNTLQLLSDKRAETEEELSEYAMFAALLTGTQQPDLTRRALRFAELNLGFGKSPEERGDSLESGKSAEKRRDVLPDMVRLWTSLGELSKARSLAEGISVGTARMELYLPILDKIIADRKAP